MKKIQCVVVGAGANGLITAHTLQQHGYEVGVIDNNVASASKAGAGILSALPPWAYPEPIRSIAATGAALYPALLEQIGHQCDYNPCGMVVIADKNNRNNHLRQQWLAQNLSRPIDDTQVSVAFAAQASALTLLPTVACINPPKLIEHLRAVLAGSIINDEVIRWTKKDGRINRVLLKDGATIACDRLILASGAWSNRFFPNGQGQPLIKPIRGQILRFNAPTIDLNHIVLDEGDGMYCLQQHNKQLIVGSTLEDVGFNVANSFAGVRLIWKKAIRFFPILRHCRPDAMWAGLRPMSHTHQPLIGRHPSVDNLFLNTGHFRYGLTMAPASAQLLVDSIKNPAQVVDWSPSTTAGGSGRT